MAKSPDEAKKPRGGWESCPLGTFGHLAGKLQGRIRRRVFLKSAVVAVSALAVTGGVGALVWLQTRPPGEPTFAGLTCTQVINNAQSFACGELSQDMQEKMRSHLALCQNCRTRFQAMGIGG